MCPAYCEAKQTEMFEAEKDLSHGPGKDYEQLMLKSLELPVAFGQSFLF